MPHTTSKPVPPHHHLPHVQRRRLDRLHTRTTKRLLKRRANLRRRQPTRDKQGTDRALLIPVDAEHHPRRDPHPPPRQPMRQRAQESLQSLAAGLFRQQNLKPDALFGKPQTTPDPQREPKHPARHGQHHQPFKAQTSQQPKHTHVLDRKHWRSLPIAGLASPSPISTKSRTFRTRPPTR